MAVAGYYEVMMQLNQMDSLSNKIESKLAKLATRWASLALMDKFDKLDGLTFLT